MTAEIKLFLKIFYALCVLICINFAVVNNEKLLCKLRGRYKQDLFPTEIQDAAEACTPGPSSCDPNNIYYSSDGSCNNLQRTNWGQAGMPFARHLPANYSDGVYKLRTATDGRPLPLARLIRTTLLQNKNILAWDINIFSYGFGQLVDLDVGSRKSISDTDAKCCTDDELKTEKNDDVCVPVKIPSDDYFYSKSGTACLDVKRSKNTKRSGCKVEPIFQINHQTSFLDLSVLYGPSEQQARQVRLLQNGQLSVSNDQQTNNQPFPPIISGAQNCPSGGIDRQPGSYCFLAGDSRINQNPELLAAYVIFLRFHNFVAKNLQQINPSWSDEQLYQTARRITIAMYQHVIMAEYIPILLGPEVTALYDLIPAKSGHVNKYDPKLNPQTLDSFTAAAGRAQHSNIIDNLQYAGSNGETLSYSLKNILFNQRFMLEKNIFDNILKAYMSQACQKQDQFAVEDIADMLFAPGVHQTADLISIDILRGRDFGLQSYNNFREACGLCRLNTFDDLANFITNKEDVKKFKSLYKSVDDIDYYVAALTEKLLNKANLGPSFACVTAESFARFKFGDRFFYEFPSAKFTTAQLQTIRRTTISGMICAANPGLTEIQKNGFLRLSTKNPMVSCQSLPRIDLSPWKV